MKQHDSSRSLRQVRCSRFLLRPLGRIAQAVGNPHPGLARLLHRSPRRGRVKACHGQVAEFGGTGPCALIGGGQAKLGLLLLLMPNK
jgi:hypothetical protein